MKCISNVQLRPYVLCDVMHRNIPEERRPHPHRGRSLNIAGVKKNSVPCPRHEVLQVERGIAPLILNLALDGGKC